METDPTCGAPGSRPQIFEATLKRSYIWSQGETLKLKQNIQVSNADQDGADFADYLGKVGRGTLSIIKNIRQHTVQLPE